MKRDLFLAACLALFTIAACSNETQLPTPTGKGSVRAINAISTSPDISFLIEERGISSVGYKQATSTAEYDDFTYVFNFEVLFPGESEATRIASQELAVVADTTYTFVISGSLADPVVTVWEGPETDFGADPTNFDVQFGHTAATVGDVDVYFADPAVVPALGNEIGTVSFGDLLPVSSLGAGDYVLTVTAPGDPADVLFQSTTIAPQGGTALIFSIFDPDANDRGPVATRGFNLTSGTTIIITDRNVPPAIRFYHASFDAGPVDIYSDDPLTVPVVAGHTFRDITADIDMPTSDEAVPITYTAAGNTGTILIDVNRTMTPGSLTHLYLFDDTSGTVVIDHTPDRRSVETLVKMSVVNTAAIDQNLDIYINPRDVLVGETNPLLGGVPPGLDPIDFDLIDGSFDIYITPNGEETILAGPVPLELALGDVVEAIIYETADPNVVDVVLVTPP